MRNKIFKYFLMFCQVFFIQQIIVNAQETRATMFLRDIGRPVSFQTEMRDAENFTLNGDFDTYVYGRRPNTINRILVDENSGLFFGYDFEIEPIPAQNAFKVSIKPLSINLKTTIKDLSRYTSSPLPKYPDSIILKEGETLLLSLLENPQTKVKIVDLIKINKAPSKATEQASNTVTGSGSNVTVVSPSSNSPTAGARDFTPDLMQLRFNNAQLYINDKRIPTSARENYVAGEGEFLYLYMPGKGRFIFSLAPHKNYDFKKIGSIENNKIFFTSGSDSYRLISDLAIFELGGKWNLWVYHDSEYKPKINFSPSQNYKVGTAELPGKN